jgi:hypothetical protein
VALRRGLSPSWPLSGRFLDGTYVRVGGGSVKKLVEVASRESGDRPTPNWPVLIGG